MDKVEKADLLWGHRGAKTYRIYYTTMMAITKTNI